MRQVTNSPPSTTQEARQAELINLAEKAAEQKLRDGTAPSQIICHYLKLSTIQYQLELEKIKKENQLLEAKTKAIAAAENTERMYGDAIEAMRKYGGYRDDPHE